MGGKERLAKVARAQHGVVTRDQVLGAGLTRHQLQALLDDGELVSAMPSVYRLSAAPLSWLSRVMAAALWARPLGGASHFTAAKLWRLDGIPSGPQPIEVTVPIGHRVKRAGVVVRVSRKLNARDFTRAQAIPVTDLVRTLCDLAVRLTEEPLELALDSARRQYPGVDGWLETALCAPWSRSGRAGAGVLIKLVYERLHGATDSALETRVARRLRREGVPPPLPQQNLSDDDGFIAIVDFLWKPQRVVLFADGYRWHHDKPTWKHDLEQRSRLTAAGYLVHTVTWDSVNDDAWLNRIREALQPSLPGLRRTTRR